MNEVFKKECKKHQRVFNRHLNAFYNLLDSKPKPSDEMVRAEFVRHESEWRIYCSDNRLGTRIADMFNANVSLAWETKYARKSKK